MGQLKVGTRQESRGQSSGDEDEGHASAAQVEKSLVEENFFSWA